MLNQYIGHPLQVSGVEEHRLVGGKGDGMRLLEVRNGRGLHFTVNLDRAADISRLYFKGDNFSYISPCGYVAPSYYDDKELGFLKSFTAGFLTTCGLLNVGSPSVDDGQKLPLHGTISNTPAEYASYTEDNDKIQIKASINQMGIFAAKLMLYRTITCYKSCDKISIEDTVENHGDTVSPLMILYHFNIGYPLLSENNIKPRDEHAQSGFEQWSVIKKPTEGFKEQCYYHFFDVPKAIVKLFNPDINKGIQISYDTEKLNYFIQWKMTGIKDYVLGLEPGNCHADGRDLMRK